MLLEIVSYNGVAINDVTNFEAWFPAGQPAMPLAQPAFAARYSNFPLLSSKSIGGGTISFHVLCKGTIHSQYEELKALFRVDDFSERTLIVKDIADSNRQWYVRGYAVAPLVPAMETAVGEYVVTLAVDLPLWRTVTSASVLWEVTASNQTKTLTVLGNQPAKPIFTLAIASAKNGGYARKWWRPYYNPLTIANNEPLELTGGWDTAALVNDTSVSNRINKTGGITSSDLSIPIDTSVGGGLPTGGGVCYVGTEQIYYTSIAAGVMTVYDDGEGTTGRGWGGTTAASHADNAVMAKSHLNADGSDVRVLQNGVEVDFWLGGMNSASTKVWFTPRFAPITKVTLDTAIASSGSVSTVTVAKTAANLAALKRMPKKFLFVIGSEVFAGSNPVPNQYRFSVTARAQRGTSEAGHAKNSVVRILQHDIWLMWGNPTAEALTVDDRRKPAFDLSASTNTSWVWSEFTSDAGLQRGAWNGSVVSRLGNTSRIYTAAEDTFADPAEVMGFAAKVWGRSGVVKADTVEMSWGVYHPAGFTTVTVSGKKRRNRGTWLTFTLDKSTNGATTNWTTVFTEATPSAVNTLENLSAHSGVSLGGSYRYVRLYADGSVTALTNNANYFEVRDATFAISSGNVPQAAISTSAEDNYYLDVTIKVDELNESISVAGPARVGGEVVIDCEGHTVTLDGVDGAFAVTWNTDRVHWLELPSAEQSATCTVRYLDAGTSGVDVTIDWAHRNTL